MSLENELQTAIELAEKAGTVVMKYYQKGVGIKMKADDTPVTEADLLSNALIVEGLQKAFPNDSIVSEETDTVPGNSRAWYIDPIDGTKQFMRGKPEFAVQIGLCIDEQPVLGVVHRPNINYLYFGTKDGGAYLRTKHGDLKLMIEPTLYASQPSLMPEQDALNHFHERMMTVSLSKGFYREEGVPEMLDALGKPGIVTSGSEGLRLMKLVHNLADLHFNEQPDHCGTWDLCAPHAILEAAGGLVQFLDGEEVTYHGKEKFGKYYLCARTPELMQYGQEKLRYLLQLS